VEQMQRRLRIIPTPAISFMVKPPALKTIALQGVDTGNMNAWLAVSVTPRAKYTGCRSKGEAMLRTTGASMLVVAELEAIWEMAEVIKQSRRRIREGGRLERLERAVPTK